MHRKGRMGTQGKKEACNEREVRVYKKRSKGVRKRSKCDQETK